MGGDAVAIIDATVGSRPEDAGNALLTPQDGARSTQKIALCKGFCRRKERGKEHGDAWRLLGCAAGAIERHFAHLAGRYARFVEAGKQLLSKHAVDLIIGEKEGIDALCGDPHAASARGSQDGPVGLGAPTICYQYHLFLIFRAQRYEKSAVVSSISNKI